VLDWSASALGLREFAAPLKDSFKRPFFFFSTLYSSKSSLFFKVVFPCLTDITSLAFAFVRVSYYLVKKSRDGIEGL